MVLMAPTHGWLREPCVSKAVRGWSEPAGGIQLYGVLHSAFMSQEQAELCRDHCTSPVEVLVCKGAPPATGCCRTGGSKYVLEGGPLSADICSRRSFPAGEEVNMGMPAFLKADLCASCHGGRRVVSHTRCQTQSPEVAAASSRPLRALGGASRLPSLSWGGFLIMLKGLRVPARAPQVKPHTGRA